MLTCEEFGFKFLEEDCIDFSNSMSYWKSFPDSVDAIKEIRKFTKFVALTNTDNDIISACLQNAGIEV